MECLSVFEYMSECIRVCMDWTGAIDPHCDCIENPIFVTSILDNGGYQSEGHNGHSLNKGVALCGSARGQHCLGQWSLGLGDVKAGQECGLVLPRRMSTKPSGVYCSS